jgi:hypothetical protein
MWLAHPVLPVGVGVFLFVALAVVSTMERQEPLPPVTPVEPAIKDLPPERSAGVLRVPEGAVPTQGVAVAGKELRERSRRGDFVGALKILQSHSPKAWVKARLAANTAGYEAQEDVLIQKASELLLLRHKSMERDKAAAALESLLVTDGVIGHPSEAKLREALAALGP